MSGFIFGGPLGPYFELFQKIMCMFAKKMNMKSIYYILLTFSIILLFSNCEEEISPGNPTNPTGLPNYFIADCDTMKVDVFFNNTYFFNEDDGVYFDIDGVQDWNHMCSQYVDEAAMITAGLTYVDIWTSTVVPTEYGSRAELKYNSSDPTNPTLEMSLTNDDSPSSGFWSDDFSLNLEIPDITNLALTQISGVPTLYQYICGWLGPNMVYNEMYAATYDIEFDTISTNLPNGGIDIANKIFQGNMLITFEKIIDYYDPITGNPVYRDTYAPQTVFPFTANVDFRLICRP